MDMETLMKKQKLFYVLLFVFFQVSSLIGAEDYILNSGDTITILVWGQKDYTQTIPIRPDGRISYPLIGEIKVAGLTTTELSEKIREELLKHLVDPQVTVVITQPKKNEIFVLGQVKFSNQFRFDQSHISLLKALSMAGGISDDTADIHNIKIFRDNGTSEVVDLEDLLKYETQQSVFLSSGDVVYVPKLERINVTGYVLTPGQFRPQSDISVAKALALAGGPLQDVADLKKALIIRATGEVIELELNSDFWTKDGSDMLHPGDTLHVPNAYEVEEVNVLGHLRNPGRYKIKRPVDALEAIALAGGIVSLNEANLHDARVIRKDGKTEYIDLSMLKKPSPEKISKIREFMIYPGDSIEIPQRKSLINWPLAFTIVSIISAIYNMMR